MADPTLDAIVEALPLAALVLDARATVRSANASARQALGRADAVGQPLAALLAPGAALPPLDDRPQEAAVEAVRPDGTRTALALAVRRLDGARWFATLRERDLPFADHAVLQAVLEAAPDALLVIDAQERIVLANRRAEDLLACPRAELVGRLAHEFRAPQAPLAPAARREVAQRLDGGAPVQREVIVRRRDGTEVPVESSMVRVDLGGRPLVVAALRDITQRRQAEHERAVLAAIVESTDDAIFSKTTDGTITSWNRAAERLYGYPAAEAVGRPAAMLLPDDLGDEEATLLGHVRAGRHVPAYETRRRARDGTVKHVAVTVSPIRDAAGRVVGASTIARDITATRASERMFRDLLEAAPDALILVDKRGIMRLVNAQAERLFGHRRDDMVGQAVELVVPERFRPRHVGHRSAFVQAPTTRPMGVGLELYALRRDGSEFPVEISLSPLDTGTGTLVMAAIRDVTEQRRGQAALRAANQELEAFAYSVSHDLRAPLRAMDGFSRILLEDHAPALAPEARHCLDIIVRSANEMSRLVDDLLALSRFGRQAIHWQTVDVAALVRSVLDELAGERTGRDVRVEVGTLPPAQGDPVLLRQVYANLLSNAFKYTRPRSPAVVEVGWEPTAAPAGAYYVRDNGVGFDMKYVDKLFGVFQRLHRAEEYEGTGVGLAIAHRIVTRHGGRIWAAAAPDAGATFFFTLGGPHA